ncbi:hypothetical protein OS493_002424 [Desmophyllum pertusum]|uniref:Uncharacterized protein n=1 Tax=Desmophyllum pertusum TaxID=174260 RepID=A0A9W9YW61_9CNID|nr:hypothetical protein OS493_002424 [Desmophyllum pertusum]
MDNENRFLTSLETSSSPAETGNYNVNSSAIIHIGMDKVPAANHSGRSHGLMEERPNVTHFKDRENASLRMGNEASLGWTELPKDINQNWFNWRSVTMSTADSPCPGYGCTPPRLRNSPAKKVTDRISSPRSAQRSQQIDDHSSKYDGNQNTTVKNHESSEDMYHTPFLMLIKHWDWLPEHITSEPKDAGKTIPVANLTDNRQNSFVDQDNPTYYNNVPCCLNISKHVTRMDNENRFLTSLENESSSSPAETGNYNVNSSEMIDIGMDKVWTENHSGRLPGQTEETPNVTSFTDHDKTSDNGSLEIGNETIHDDWIELERLTGHKFEMCPWRFK